MPDDTEWMVAAQAYLQRVGRAEYEAQRRVWTHKTGFRFKPSQYMLDLIECMNRNDEEAFKARKMWEGYPGAIGV